MANKKITELTAITDIATADVLPIVDVSADETKKVTTVDFRNTSLLRPSVTIADSTTINYPIASGADASTMLQQAITDANTAVGRGIDMSNGKFLLGTSITVPKLGGVKLFGSGVPKGTDGGTGHGGTRIYANASMTNMFDWRGEGDIQAGTDLGIDFQLSDMMLNGNSLVTNALIYAKSTDYLKLNNVRLTGAPTALYGDFATTTTPVAGALLAGGVFIDDAILQGIGAPAMVLKYSTQNFLSRIWFEGSTGSPVPSMIDLYSVNKTAFMECEFNTVANSAPLVRLYDTTDDATTGVILANCKFDGGTTSTIIQDNRVHTSAKGLFITGVAATGTLGTGLLNQHTNIVALASVYTMSKSILQAGILAVTGPAATERTIDLRTNDTLRAQLYLTSSSESGGDAGSNIAIGTYDDTGATRTLGFYITRSDAVTHIKTLSLFGTSGLGYVALPSDGTLKVGSDVVVRARQVDARCDDTINTVVWDATTAGVLDSLRDAMITHGLIAAA